MRTSKEKASGPLADALVTMWVETTQVCLRGVSRNLEVTFEGGHKRQRGNAKVCPNQKWPATLYDQRMREGRAVTCRSRVQVA